MTETDTKSDTDDRKRKLALALAILESSESNDSTDDEILQMLIKERVLRPKHKKRQSLMESYAEEDFRREFRMKRETCSKIINDFEKSPFYPKNDSHGGTPKSSAENHVLSFLKFAGSKTCISEVASQFCIGESTFHRQCGRVMHHLNDIAPSIIRFPKDNEEKKAIAHHFEQISGFPGVLGCIGSTYIPIRAPANKNKSSYVNHQQKISITLQGICDANGVFLDVFTGPPSKIHDARVYKLSFVYQRLPELCSDDLHLIGDETYPLSDHMLVPYMGQNDQTSINYNSALQLSLQPVEKSFRLLKQRFKQLSRLDFHQVDTTTKFTIACCVLHNLCILDNDFLLEDVDVQTCQYDGNATNHFFDNLCFEASEPFELTSEELQSKQMGEIKRDRISAELWVKYGKS
ncbi:Uncharacterized protein APZ42_027640 [Daphnia magna]|uniref:Uncharacterized protein n=1 Tax=Daphnia magna TaxID=35525 RepID=A0A0P5YGT6_9CRUS|nr:Uncharacterized protein APZ42_027640 [Daphnia magna]